MSNNQEVPFDPDRSAAEKADAAKREKELRELYGLESAAEKADRAKQQQDLSYLSVWSEKLRKLLSVKENVMV